MGFEYFEPVSIEEACELLSKEEGSRIIAGGQSLMVLIKQRLFFPKALISINGIKSLNYINYDEKEGLKIGAKATHRSVEKNSIVKEKFPVLSDAISKIGSIHIRNVGTLVGSICHADPAGDAAPVLLCLDAKVKTASLSGERIIPIGEFFKGYLETVLKEDEIAVEIEIPNLPDGSSGTYIKHTLRSGDTPIVGVAVVITLNKNICEDARIALSGAGSIPIRAKRAEEVLRGKEITLELAKESGKSTSEEASPISDINGSEEYKRDMIRILTRDAIMESLKRS
jgi:carbon-monoxide dehydrogenase medium subunit